MEMEEWNFSDEDFPLLKGQPIALSNVEPKATIETNADLLYEAPQDDKALNQKLLKKYYEYVPADRRLDSRRELAAYQAWSSALAPEMYSGFRPHGYKEFQLIGMQAWQQHERERAARAPPEPPLDDPFSQSSPRARMWALQFIFDCKLRAFGAAPALEQEMRKHPDHRVFLKALAPRDYRRPRGVLMRALEYVNGTMPRWHLWAKHRSGMLDFGDALLRGAGQVYFANNPISGLIVMVALAVSSGWLMMCSLLGLFCSTLFAVVLGVNHSALSSGLFGYNGILVGGSMAVFLDGGPYNPLALPLIFFGSLFCTIFNLALGNALAPTWGTPPMTFPFIFTTQMLIAMMPASAHFHALPAFAPSLTAVSFAPLTWDTGMFFAGWMRGIGQIFFCDNVWSGVLLSLGLCFYSRISAIAALFGSFVGMAVGFMLGVDSGSIYAGLWGYNPALIMIALCGVFYVPSSKTFAVALIGAIMSAFLTGSLGAVFSPFGVPQLTFAFSLTAFLFVLIQYSIKSIAPIPLVKITTPEAHLLSTRRIMRVLRIWDPGYRSWFERRHKNLDAFSHAPDVPVSWGESEEGVCARLLAAASSGDLETVRQMSAANISVAQLKDYDDRTALHLAAAKGRPHIIRFLLGQRGVSVNARDINGVTPLHEAVRARRKTAIDILRPHGALFYQEACIEEVMYACAASTRNVSLLKWFARAGLPFGSLCDYDSRSPLHVAVSDGDAEIIALLLKAGCSEHKRDRWGHKASYYDATGVLKSIAGTSAHPSFSSSSAEDEELSFQQHDVVHSQLCSAAAAGNVEDVNMLLEEGVDVNEHDYDQRTALHLACANGRLAVVSRLMREPGIKFEAVDRNKNTPLSEAIRGGFFAISQQLRQAGAVLSGQLGYKLCAAAAEGDLESLEAFQRTGNDLNLGDYDQRTALHLAACNNQLRVCKFLLSFGARKNSRDRFGNTPYDDAIENGHKEIANMLFS